MSTPTGRDPSADDSPTEVFLDPNDLLNREHQRQEELGQAILSALTDPPLRTFNTRRATASPPTRQPSIVILSPRLSPSPSPDPTSERLSSLVALLHERRASQASPPLALPNPPPAPGNTSNAAANLTRAEALQRYLDRRLVEGVSALPPHELVDWRIVERRSNSELEVEVQSLLAAAGSTPGREEEEEDEGDSPELLFITSLRMGSEARRRRLQTSLARLTSADGGTLDWDTPLPVRRSILEESRGVGDSELMELVDTPQSPGWTARTSEGWDMVMSPEERRARVEMMDLAELRGQEERLEEIQRELDALERDEAELERSGGRIWRVRSRSLLSSRSTDGTFDSSTTPSTSTDAGSPTPPTLSIHSTLSTHPTRLLLPELQPLVKPSLNPAKKSNGAVAPPPLPLPTPAVSQPSSSTSTPSAPTRATGVLHSLSKARVARAGNGGRGRRRTPCSGRRCARRRRFCCCIVERGRRSCRVGSSGRARVEEGVGRWCVRGDWGKDLGGCLGVGRGRKRLFRRICRRGWRRLGMWRGRGGRGTEGCWGALGA